MSNKTDLCCVNLKNKNLCYDYLILSGTVLSVFCIHKEVFML